MNAEVRAALEGLLRTDPQFVADWAALGHAPITVLRGNRRFDQLPQENMPCVVTEAGDLGDQSADNEGISGRVIGSHEQEFGGYMELSFVWLQDAFDVAVNQRDALWPALARLLLRNPDLGGACTDAYLASVENDRGYRHPTHVLVARVRASVTIDRD